MQIKVTLDELNYKCLKASAQMNRRTLSGELNTMLDKLYADTRPDSTVDTLIKEETITPEPAKPKPKRTVIGNEDEYNNLLNNFIKFLDDEQISPNDTSWELFEGIKKQVPEFKDLNITIFDKAQEIRKSKED